MSSRTNRRQFLGQSLAAGAAAGMVPYIFTSTALAQETSANDRPVLGCIGTGSRWNAVGPAAMNFSDCVAVCDVDKKHMEGAKNRCEGIQSRKGSSRKIDMYEDYQDVLAREDIDVVTIVTPDHWHTKIAIEAMQAGKDVYCEKPLTLTIEEGKQICEVVKKTGRVFQVGTQQRSEMGLRFLTAVAMIRDGRIGKVKTVQCAIGGAPSSPEIPVVDPPEHLNWEKWLGQAPLVDYRQKGRNTRCHYEFRWWYEYSGGKLTDWGAHHVDIAQWAINQNGEDQGPTQIRPRKAVHPVPLKDGWPTDPSRYNTATGFYIEADFADDVKMVIRHDTNNGIIFDGEDGQFFVSRGQLIGKPVDELKSKPLPEGLLAEVYGGEIPQGGSTHMRNFFECLKTRKQPVSDVFTHHRAMTTCHLANIAIRLDKTLNWDPAAQQIVGDEEANAWQTREQREGYKIKV